MKVLITGAAGFIGSSVAYKLLENGVTVVGVDNHNDYYDPSIKQARVDRLASHPNYTHCRIDLADRKALHDCFVAHKPNRVINLAAQAGVRYSIENPLAYIESNIVGFAHILEECRHNGVEHLVYASSSSVYGGNTAMPFSVHHNVDHPLSLYAASKKSNELMAHSYSHLYQLPTTGLRFFTVYGPWGRPDMSLFKFTKAILAGEPIQVFNHGKHRRDFTYIDDIVDGVIKVLARAPEPDPEWRSDQPDPGTSHAPWRIYNIGNNNPVELMDFISILEKRLDKKAVIEFLPLQPGDIPESKADVSDLEANFQYRPNTRVEDGIDRFVEWYRAYFNA
ncbi:NAD-dependent epimerase [Ottowia thiooxydans]|uniref:NAD-dependent epimerase n=1 Tax=Ottowia thiooxydans TaxID=219182 RepID=UPI0004129DF9|nr:NAD-dependent epimerase [Ottowia thiooxydans]